MKVEVRNNNVEQALRILKEKHKKRVRLELLEKRNFMKNLLQNAKERKSLFKRL